VVLFTAKLQCRINTSIYTAHPSSQTVYLFQWKTKLVKVTSCIKKKS